MSFQLIFTSTPRGLTLGRSGFCTVARHREISDSLVTALERCSAYERSENPGSELPVIHAYRILRLGSSSYHVLTRIQDSGVDYTQRGNHIAQHLIFLPGELAETPTPADIFLNWNGWLEAWNEAPRYLDASEQPRLASIAKSTSLPAQTWQHRTGDSVHAALLAQPDLRRGAILTGQSLPSDRALHLMGESLLLIETEEAGLPGPWNIPFTTHLQSHDQEEDFFWRCEESSDPGLITSRQGFPVLSLDSSAWPPVTVPTLAKRAREGGASVLKLKDTARLPDLSSRSEDSEVVPKIGNRPVSSSSSPRPTQFSAPKKNWGMPAAAVGLIVVILAAAWFFTRASSSSTPSLSGQLAQLQTPGQREPLRSFLREHPVPTGNTENDALLEKAALWLEASDYLENLQFLRRQEQADSLREAVLRIQNLPKLSELKQVLPPLGYEITEAQTWLDSHSAAVIPAPVPTPAPETIATAPPIAPVSLVHFFGNKPVILSTLNPEKILTLSQIPAVTDWMAIPEKSPGRQIRILPLNSLPLSGEGTIARPQSGRNRSDPVRFYQGVHLLFESKKIGELEGTDSFEFNFAKDFDTACPSGTFGRVLQFEDASGLLFSIFILNQEEPGPLLRLPRSMIDLDPSTQNYGLRKEFYRDAQLSLAGKSVAFLGAPTAQKIPAGAVNLGGTTSWDKLQVPPTETNLPALALQIQFSSGEEGRKPLQLFLFEGNSRP